MRNLINIGKDDDLYVDTELVVLLMPDEQKGFGTLVFMEGAPAPVRTSLTPKDVYSRLNGMPDMPKLVS